MERQAQIQRAKQEQNQFLASLAAPPLPPGIWERLRNKIKGEAFIDAPRILHGADTLAAATGINTTVDIAQAWYLSSLTISNSNVAGTDVRILLGSGGGAPGTVLWRIEQPGNVPVNNFEYLVLGSRVNIVANVANVTYSVIARPIWPKPTHRTYNELMDGLTENGQQ